MVKLRRPDASSREPATDPRGGAYQDLPADLRGEAGHAVGGTAVRDVDKAPEHDRRRERRLVESACRGENSAIEALYRTHFDTIYRYVLLRLGAPSAAEDVTSQVFLGMLRGLATIGTRVSLSWPGSTASPRNR